MKIKILFIVIALIIVGIATFAYIKLSPEQVTIPQELTKQNEAKKLTEYIPGWLPGTFKIDKDSFSRQEGQVFVFSATDENRNRLFFSQQPRVKDFDFEKFYTSKVLNPIKLEGVPYESVYAKSLFGKTWILSIVTETTWIMMTTETPISTVMAQKIVQEMKQY
jgi:hypothetical protein